MISALDHLQACAGKPLSHATYDFSEAPRMMARRIKRQLTDRTTTACAKP